MLERDASRFTRGRSRFADHTPEARDPTARVYVRVRFGDDEVFALLDTGAAWSVMPPQVARLLGVSSQQGDPARMVTPYGLIKGQLVRVPFTFLADEGEDLELTGTFLISEDWPVRITFLGYSGLLDSIRFALDPQANEFYFGPPADSW